MVSGWKGCLWKNKLYLSFLQSREEVRANDKEEQILDGFGCEMRYRFREVKWDRKRAGNENHWDVERNLLSWFWSFELKKNIFLLLRNVTFMLNQMMIHKSGAVLKLGF